MIARTLAVAMFPWVTGWRVAGLLIAEGLDLAEFVGVLPRPE
jgi:hypothetical protein